MFQRLKKTQFRKIWNLKLSLYQIEQQKCSLPLLKKSIGNTKACLEAFCSLKIWSAVSKKRFSDKHPLFLEGCLLFNL